VFDQAIHLDEFDDYVALQDLNYIGSGHTQVSVYAWIRTRSPANQHIASFDRNECWRLQIAGEVGGPGLVGWSVMTNSGQLDYGSIHLTTYQPRFVAYRSLTIGKANFEPNPQANTNIPGYVVYDLMTNDQGNIWVATDNGISIIDGTCKLLNHFDADDGLGGNEVLCMNRDASGTLWIGTDKGPASFRDGQWTDYPECPAGIVLAVTADPAGNIYFGTYRHGIIVYNGKHCRRHNNCNSRLPHNMVTALTYDEQNRLWAGTVQGLLCIGKDSQQVYTKENSGLLSNKITDLLADGPSIWIATDAGIARREYKN
jgi:hypothetical protein